MKSRKYVWIIVIVVTLLAGCGGSGSEGEPPAPTSVPPTSTTAATPTLSAGDHVDQGMEYYDQGELDKAIAEFEKAIELDPNDAEAHRNLGTAYGEQGKWEECAAAYERAIEIDPDFGEAYGDLTAAYFYLERIPEALEAGEKAIELAPDYATAHNNLGIVYKEQGEFDLAIVEYKKAIELDPSDPKPHNNLGNVYKQQGKFDLAIAEYEKALETDPDYATAYLSLGLLYAQQDMVDEAIAEFETYLQRWPNASNREKVEEWLAELESQDSEYVNAEGGYSVLYPAGWYYKEDGARVGLAESQQAYEASSLVSPLVTLFVTPLAQAAQSMGLEESAAPAEFLEVMTGRIKAEVEGMEEAQIVGYPAAVAATSGTTMDSPYRGDMIIILVEERLFLAEAIAPPDQWDAFRPTFVDMINGLTFFEPGSAGTSSVDFTDPVSVLQAVFTAAQAEDFAVLSNLCDPQGENDDDTALICAITADHPDKDSFVEYFAQAKVAGEVAIDGDRAEIPFLFGPDGDQEETMGLIQRDGKWYLSDF
jgi:tetratricopeptide (TPR) repeat protein